MSPCRVPARERAQSSDLPPQGGGCGPAGGREENPERVDTRGSPTAPRPKLPPTPEGKSQHLTQQGPGPQQSEAQPESTPAFPSKNGWGGSG